MKALIFTCARSVAIDARSGGASLFYIIEEVTTPVFPSVLPPFSVYALISREPGEPDSASLTLRVTMDGQTLSENAVAVTFQDKARAHVTGEIQNFMVPGAGTLAFALLAGPQELASWQMPVSVPPVLA